MAKHQVAINDDIKAVQVRLVGIQGEQLGIVSLTQAKSLAVEQSVDLVLIAPQAKPPVCKLMNYSKFKFEQEKRDKEQRKNQKVIETKEIRLSSNIDIGDFNTKLNHARKFLNNGDKVKVSIRFRGREMAHTDLGRGVMLRFANECSSFAAVDKNPKLDGRHMIMFLAPIITK